MVINADTNQYQTIYCNVAACIALPCSVICLMAYTGWRDQRHCSIAAQAHNSLLARVIKLNVKCCLYCCLLPSCSSIHLRLWGKSDWMFPWFASYWLLYTQRRQITVDGIMNADDNPTRTPANVTQSIQPLFSLIFKDRIGLLWYQNF